MAWPPSLLTGFLLAVAILVPLYTAIARSSALELGAVALHAGADRPLRSLLLLGEYRALPGAALSADAHGVPRRALRSARLGRGATPLYALACWGHCHPHAAAWPIPGRQASFIERFKMRHTSYGDLHGRFEGRGLALFLRGLPIWLLVVGVPIIAIVVMARLIDWNMLGNALAAAQGDGDSMNTLIKNNPQLGEAIGIVDRHLLRRSWSPSCSIRCSRR